MSDQNGSASPQTAMADVALPGNITMYTVPTTFAREFQGIRGVPPTAEETRRHLEYDRLAKSSALDPMTMSMIVAGSRDAELAAALECDRKTIVALEAHTATLVATLAQAELHASEARTALTASLARIERKAGTRSSWTPPATELRAAAVGAISSALIFCGLIEFQLRPTAVGLMLAIIATAGACAAFAWWRAKS